MTENAPRTILRALFDAALAAAAPAACVPPHLPPPPKGRTVVVGAGKAAAAMAAAVEAHWRGPLSGIVVTRYGHDVPCRQIEVIEAGHPLPDDAGRDAARRILAAVGGLGPDDLVLCLISGGGSALLAAPAPGVPLADKQAVSHALLLCGATIGEINCVRKHLSAIKGGRLALAARPARLVALAISDVPGDDPTTIASGPTVADPTSYADARAVLAKYRIAAPESVARRLAAGDDETPKPGDSRLGHAEMRIVLRPADMLAAAARAAERLGLRAIMLGDTLEGEARALGRAHAALSRREAGPAVILSGGETTVTVTGEAGQGGRNGEYALALAIALDGAPHIHALAADTDGIDGAGAAAGAIIAPDTLARARAAGIDPALALARHDSHGLFGPLGDLLITGPTRTNVNDYRAILITR
jgi:hydroxypyruvate reductase